MLFLGFALNSMCKFNALFQSDIPMLPTLKAEVHRLLRIFLGRFLVTECIHTADSSFMDINLQDPNVQLPDNQICIGQDAWAYLSSEEDVLDSNVHKSFFNGVREFYVVIASTILHKFPFSDTLVDDIAVFLPNNHCRLAQRFPVAVPQNH